MEPPDRDSNSLMVVIVAVVLLAGAGGAFWILRSHPKPKAAPHAPCQPLGVSPTGAPATTIAAGDWELSVNGVHFSSTLPNEKGVDSFQLSSSQVYLVVDLALTNPNPGQEAEIASAMFSLVCEDGTTNTVDGLNQGEGFCQVCSVDIGVSDPTLSWSLAFEIDRRWTEQAFGLRYGQSATLPLPAP